MNKWWVYLKDNRVSGVMEVTADTLIYDKRSKSYVFKAFQYEDEVIVAAFPQSGINGIIRA